MPHAPVSATELWCLGVGDGRPCPGRGRSGYLYSIGGQSVLIDCGEGICRALSHAKVGGDEIGHVILSHMHSDHVGSFSLLIQDLWLSKRRRPLTVSAPAAAIPQLQDWLNHTLLVPDLLLFPIRWTPLLSGQAFRKRPLRIAAHPTRHLEVLAGLFSQSHRETCFEAFSFVLEGVSKRVAHTADIGHEDDLDPLLTEPLDLLVCELAHVDPQKIFAKLHGRQIAKIAFIHLTDEYWRDRARLKQEARKSLGSIPFRFARDGERIGF